MKFRSGKYAGKDIEYVRRVAPWYIDWVKLNRPEMLKGVGNSKKVKDTKPSAYDEVKWLRNLKPNLDFYNEKSEITERVVESEPKSNRYW